MDTVISQITLVMERERLNEEKEDTKIQIEKERLEEHFCCAVFPMI